MSFHANKATCLSSTSSAPLPNFLESPMDPLIHIERTLFLERTNKPSFRIVSAELRAKARPHRGIADVHKKHSMFSRAVTEANQAETDAASNAAARPVYPFSAIIGQEEMKFAAIMNIIDPNIGGIMVMGDRGTGKSTTVRSLDAVARFFFNAKSDFHRCLLPATLAKEGTKAFEPGLLAKESLANRGILYVDEVNLLDDHLVDVLLDSAASGWNTVEREGISICHPARFILIGSGNPEEGELRPQLLDRFGMHAQIKTVKLPERVRVVEERTAFDTSPNEFRKSTLHLLLFSNSFVWSAFALRTRPFAEYESEQRAIISKLDTARELLPSVQVPMEIRLKISQVCSELDVDGLRGDLVTTRASRAAAAYRGANEVTDEDVYSVVTLCLRHRLRKDPMATIDEGTKVLEVFSSVFGYDSEE
eukprot:30916-Pelagococcus_subviridis.AAC.3